MTHGIYYSYYYGLRRINGTMENGLETGLNSGVERVIIGNSCVTETWAQCFTLTGHYHLKALPRVII